MTVFKQISMGALVLGACIVIHVATLSIGISLIETLAHQRDFGGEVIRRLILILGASGIVLVGHTLQIWVWAVIVQRMAALDQFADAMYFSLVTTTTLGYGDVTLGRKHRIFGAMAAVSGLLTFGLSTAFFIGVVTKVLDLTP